MGHLNTCRDKRGFVFGYTKNDVGFSSFCV